MKFLELKIPPVALFLLIGVGMWLLSRVAPVFYLAFPARNIVAVSCVLIGLLVGVAGVLSFRSARTTVDPRFPEKSSAVVSTGIYRRSRNPMYLGLLIILLGWALFLADGFSLVGLPLFAGYMNRFQIRPEEQAMAMKFGDEYRAYTETVRRWI